MQTWLDVEQAQVLLICARAFKSSVVSASQEETGEMPLRIRRVKIMLVYWSKLQGHSRVGYTLERLSYKNAQSTIKAITIVSDGNAKAQNAGLDQLHISPTMAASMKPAWKFIKPSL